MYTAAEPEHSDVHMLPYPIKVDAEGSVNSLDAPWDCFPDTYAKIRGAKSGFLPVKLMHLFSREELILTMLMVTACLI